MGEGNTAMILAPFLEGMKDAGADVEIIYTKKLSIAPCNGDMSCWTSHPGECGMKDDMQNILPKISKADILVWASPVYYAGITGPLKNLMDRQLPLFTFGREDPSQRKKYVLVSTCGDWGMSMFEPLIVQMNALYKRPDGGSDFAGAVLRPHAEVLKEFIKAGESGMAEGIFQAAREAGRQLVKDGKMSDEVLGAVSRALVSEQVYYKAAAERFQ